MWLTFIDLDINKKKKKTQTIKLYQFEFRIRSIELTQTQNHYKYHWSKTSWSNNQLARNPNFLNNISFLRILWSHILIKKFFYRISINLIPQIISRNILVIVSRIFWMQTMSWIGIEVFIIFTLLFFIIKPSNVFLIVNITYTTIIYFPRMFKLVNNFYSYIMYE